MLETKGGMGPGSIGSKVEVFEHKHLNIKNFFSSKFCDIKLLDRINIVISNLFQSFTHIENMAGTRFIFFLLQYFNLNSQLYLIMLQISVDPFQPEMEKGGRSGRAACANFSQLC